MANLHTRSEAELINAMADVETKLKDLRQARQRLQQLLDETAEMGVEETNSPTAKSLRRMLYAVACCAEKVP